MNRRQMLQTSVLAVLAGAMAVPPDRSAIAATGSRIRKPHRLTRGNTIGLIAPASNTSEDEDIRFAGDVVRSLGFDLKEGKHLYQRNQYLAGTDTERAGDVNAMFADEAVDAIFCLRGGYGSPRILPHLDYELIAANPKVFLGNSDITGILTAMHVKAGLVGFHGPNAGQNYSDYALTEFKKVLVDPQDSTIIGQPPSIDTRPGVAERSNRITRFGGGIARGRLIGGNLSLIVALLGTPYQPNFRDRILFLEDVNEEPYRVDRMLTHLWLAGKLNEVAGIAFGKFTKADSSGNSFSMEEVIRMRCAPLGIPVVRGLMIGHIADKTVVPIGIDAELNADAGTLRLLEAAVT